MSKGELGRRSGPHPRCSFAAYVGRFGEDELEVFAEVEAHHSSDEGDHDLAPATVAIWPAGVKGGFFTDSVQRQDAFPGCAL